MTYIVLLFSFIEYEYDLFVYQFADSSEMYIVIVNRYCSVLFLLITIYRHVFRPCYILRLILKTFDLPDLEDKMLNCKTIPDI